MTSRAKGKGVWETFLGEDVVEKFGPFVEPVAIVVAAIEVKCQVGEALRMLGQSQRVVGLPIALIKG
jgi:hypothetical protein